ncbi:MAG: hypothetical protein ACOC5T_02325 [Elusimicrobiota bacterium]
MKIENFQIKPLIANNVRVFIEFDNGKKHDHEYSSDTEEFLTLMDCLKAYANLSKKNKELEKEVRSLKRKKKK